MAHPDLLPNRRTFLGVAGACVGGALLPACGGGGSAEASTSAPTATPNAPPPAPVGVNPLPPAPPPVVPYAGPPTPLDRFAASVTAGTATEFAAPTLADDTLTGSYPFDPPRLAMEAGLAPAQLLDWATMMDVDPVTRRYYVSGGRPRQHNEPLKLVVYDEVADTWSSVDQWSPRSACGHLYRATTVMPGPRLVAYHPSVANPDGSTTIELWHIDRQAYHGSIAQAPKTIGGFTNSWTGAMFLCWHPTLGNYGSLVFANSSRSRICRFDWATQQWLDVGNFDGEWVNQHINGHFHPVMGRMIVGSSTADAPRRLAIVNPDGTTTLTGRPCPVSMICGGTTGGPFFPHDTKPLSILFDRESSRIWTYNWVDDAWVDRAAIPDTLATPNTIALPHASGHGTLFVEYSPSGRSTTHYWKPPEDWA